MTGAEGAGTGVAGAVGAGTLGATGVAAGEVGETGITGVMGAVGAGVVGALFRALTISETGRSFWGITGFWFWLSIRQSD